MFLHVYDMKAEGLKWEEQDYKEGRLVELWGRVDVSKVHNATNR